MLGLLNLRRCLRLWPLILVGLIALWWTQPHFGWNYCVLDGFKRNSEFIEDLYPFHSRYDASAIEWEHQRAANTVKARFDGLVSQDRVDLVEKKAFAAMAECYAERGPRYCRYAGPDDTAFVRGKEDRRTIRPDEAAQYRYIVPNSEAGMKIIPLAKGFGSEMTIIDYTENWEFTRIICVPGCNCSPRFDG